MKQGLGMKKKIKVYLRMRSERKAKDGEDKVMVSVGQSIEKLNKRVAKIKLMGFSHMESFKVGVIVEMK